jgi:hypothetical protein
MEYLVREGMRGRIVKLAVIIALLLLLAISNHSLSSTPATSA